MKHLLSRQRPLALTATSITAMAAVVAAAVVGLHSQQAEANPPAAAPQAIPVSVATVTSQDVAAWEEFSGRLEAVERVEIFWPVTRRTQVITGLQPDHAYAIREGGVGAQELVLRTFAWPAPGTAVHHVHEGAAPSHPSHHPTHTQQEKAS